ncbi:hypothetical protein PG301_15140 [Parageobacillus sp. G301]|nr:hypothetical protein PG301_15140 [Parageobacillus sp. G301]
MYEFPLSRTNGRADCLYKTPKQKELRKGSSYSFMVMPYFWNQTCT